MKKKNHFNSGETLVEAMVGIFIFLIILAGLQSAISFCTNAQKKSEAVRKQNTEICRSLHKGTYQDGAETKEFEFKATIADGEITGTETLFKVKVNLGTVEAEYQEEDGSTEKVKFYLFGKAPSGGLIMGLEAVLPWRGGGDT